MKILISGATGFIGKPLTEKLLARGHEITRLSRSYGTPGLHWDPIKRELHTNRLEGYDAVIHLSGESIAGRFTAAKKKRIMESRREGTQFLVETLLTLKNPPKHFISSSAIGYYGNRNDEELTESSGPGTDFLAEVCKAWEAATEPLKAKGIRVANIRTGIVLDPKGGALEKLLLPFKLGAGGPIGSGKQWWSWIMLEDLLNIYIYALENESISGAINAAAPNATRNKDFVKALGKAMHRPSFMPLPSFAVKLLLGEMGDALLLSSQHVIPKKLTDSGFTFKHPNLEEGLESIL
jgi:uncharacterized protein (TIGR01777 family)